MRAGYARFLDPDRYPCQQPPWGELTAVNANTGDIAWKVPLPTPNVGGTIATAGGLVFVAATNDATFRAFDSRTGKELWSASLDASGNATPVTYLGRSGKQYVAIVAGGPAHLRNVGDTSNDKGDSLIAFALSQTPVVSDRTSDVRPAPAPPPATRPAVELPEAPGKDVVVRMCTSCHGTDTFISNRMDAAEWAQVIADMQARGARGSADDVRIAVDYLGKNLGSSRSSSSGFCPF